MNTQRPLSVTVAGVLLALFSVLNLATPLIPVATDGVPAYASDFRAAAVSCVRVAASGERAANAAA